MRSSTLVFWFLMLCCAGFFAYGLWRFFDLGTVRIVRVWWTPPWRRYTSPPVWSEGAPTPERQPAAVGDGDWREVR